jgi:hypothetical protein
VKSLEPLINLFGYLHEDYEDDYGEARWAVDAFAREEPVYAPLVRADIFEITQQLSDESELRKALLALGLAYRPAADGWESHRSWLLSTADAIDRVLSTATGAD